jgi:hypothetical protein
MVVREEPINMLRIISIPKPNRGGRRRSDSYNDIAQRVLKLPAGKALELNVPENRTAHNYRTSLRMMLGKRGLNCKTQVLSAKKIAVWIEK